MTAVVEPRTTVVRYEPRGGAADLLRCREPVILMSGPAGTGKSLAALFKLHLSALQMPHLRGLIVRQTHVSLTSTTLITFEQEVIAAALREGIVRWFGGSNRQPAAYRYANGSTITVGGLDKPEKFLSSQYDRVVVDEATEITETALETLMTRLRAPTPTYKQICLLCNPDAPQHWLNQRATKGALPVLHSRHKDNPAYFHADGSMTDRGRDYMAKLDMLTGVRRLRYRDGIWAAAEGVIYDTFDPAIHLVPKPTFGPGTELCSAGLPWSWTRYWSIDFGFTHPFVLQRWAEDPDGRLWRYAEIYRTERLVEDHAADVMDQVSRPGTREEGLAGKRRWTEPQPQAVVCDWDAEGRATFEQKTGLPTTKAKKAVTEGIEAVKSRLKIAGDGRARLFLVQGARTVRDRALADRSMPTCTEEEIGGYVWDAKKEQPVKEQDDGCLVAGTLVETEHGPRRIEDVAAGDRVWTRGGLRAVLASGMTDANAEVFALSTPDGGELTGTGNHPVWTENRGWIRMDSVRYGDIMVTWSQSKPLRSTVSASGAIHSRMIGRLAPISRPELGTSSGGSRTSTGRSGRRSTARSRLATKSTTLTSIRSTTQRPTSCASPSPSTRKLTANVAASVRANLRPWLTWTASGRSLRSGIGLRQVANGIERTPKTPVSDVTNCAPAYASSAILLTKRLGWPATGSARTLASPHGAESAASTMSNAPAPVVVQSSLSAGTRQRGSVHGGALRATRCSGRVPVFNLTVEGNPEYFANGVLVHNCDTTRYCVAHADLGRTKWMRWVA